VQCDTKVGTTLQPAEDPNEYAEGNDLEAWKKKLKEGAIEYRVPTAMLAQRTSTVTVKIHGYQDNQGTQPMPGETGHGSLKVSSHMKVELFAPYNPGEFTIVRQGSDDIQFVPNDGYQTWTWIVTPTNGAEDQTLQIRVSLVYEGKKESLAPTIKEKTYTVNVEVQKFKDTVSQAFWKDPLAWFKYMLPGGTGWSALAGLVTSLGGLTWWKRRRKMKVREREADSAVKPASQ